MSNYIPPAVSWRLPVFVDAPMEEIQAKIVDCDTCPVRAQCDAGQGGTGWTCSKCRTTGVWLDRPVPLSGQLPKDIIAIDCSKHKFETRSEATNITCSLCQGSLMELEAMKAPWLTNHHYVVTKYSAVPVAERQAFLKQEYVKYLAIHQPDKK